MELVIMCCPPPADTFDSFLVLRSSRTISGMQRRVSLVACAAPWAGGQCPSHLSAITDVEEQDLS
eukprot:768556-Hanusia_phi.AAC.5